MKRQSSARRQQRLIVAVAGRRRRTCRDSCVGPTGHARYRRPDCRERLEMWRLADLGVSARAIGRALNRDHHTVGRQLERDRGEDLALLLAAQGDGRSAREVVRLLGGSVALAAEVNDVLLAYWALRGEEGVRLTAIALASL